MEGREEGREEVRWREGRKGERRVEGEENSSSEVRVGEKELNENYEQETN